MGEALDNVYDEWIPKITKGQFWEENQRHGLNDNQRKVVCMHCKKKLDNKFGGNFNALFAEFPICKECTTQEPGRPSIFGQLQNEPLTKKQQVHTTASLIDIFLDKMKYETDDALRRSAQARADAMGKRRKTRDDFARDYGEDFFDVSDIERQKRIDANVRERARAQAEARERERRRASRKYKTQPTKPIRECPPYGAFCYELLGVPNASSMKDVKTAFRQKALKTHPDRGGTKAEFQIINSAYQTIIGQYKN